MHQASTFRGFQCKVGDERDREMLGISHSNVLYHGRNKVEAKSGSPATNLLHPDLKYMPSCCS